MRKIQGLSVLVLCLMMVLTACSGGNNPSATNAPKESAVNKATDAPSEEPVQEAVDMGGRVIKVASWWDLTPQGESASTKARLAKIAEVEKKYNCKIEFLNVTWDEYMPKFTATVLAGEPFADIAMMQYQQAFPFIQKGQILKLSEFTTAASNINNEANLLMKLHPLLGDDYAFDGAGTGGAGIHYNRDLFKKLGLPDLQEIYNSGQWNWDKFLEIAKLATKDTDNDGKTDVWGYAGDAGGIFRSLTYANGGFIVDENTAQQGFTDPRTIEAAEFVNRMYNIDNVVRVKSGNKTFWEERDTFKDGDSAMFLASQWQLGDLTFDVGVVPIPNGPQGTPDVTYAEGGGQGLFIAKGVKDPEMVYRIFEETFDIPNTQEFPSQEWLEEMYKHEEDVLMIRDHINGTGHLLLDGIFPEYPTDKFLEDIIVNNQSVTATAEKYKPEAEASIAKLGK